MNIYTQLIDGDKIGEELVLPFPNNVKHDEKAREVTGDITSIYYTKK